MMARAVPANYDGEGCTCKDSDGDAGSEDRSLARVHQCGDEQDDKLAMMVRAVPVRTVMEMPSVRTGPWLMFTSV
jgi:hypothetical protein